MEEQARPILPYAPLDRYQRRATVSVRVAGVSIGGDAPVRVQSMTTTRGGDVELSVAQSKLLVEAGAELVRITTPTVQDAAKLGEVVEALRETGCCVPIVADIHFSPEAALEAARWADKVRINPGNYASTHPAVDEAAYAQALEEMQRRIAPLLSLCKQRGVAVRIGVNHGSLSPRVVERWGAGAEGMVQSALEVVEICRRLDFHNLVISLKASNPKIMVQSNRLLVARMNALGWDYPLHLGVTEAGADEDGRVKSAIGIGALLAEGIGDTIRVSLTEKPEKEIPVCREIVSRVMRNAQFASRLPLRALAYDPFLPAKREIFFPPSLSAGKQGILAAFLFDTPLALLDEELLNLGFQRNADRFWEATDTSFDLIFLEDFRVGDYIPYELQGYFAVKFLDKYPHLYTALDQSWEALWLTPEQVLEEKWSGIMARHPDWLIVLEEFNGGHFAQRVALNEFLGRGVKNPVLIAQASHATLSDEKAAISASVDFGALLLDNLAEGIVLPAPTHQFASRRELGLSILQACQMRRARAEFISCPGCGRTLFDLVETTQRVRQATQHLKHLKIAVMGCIVNGPGEMADADYGYVGAGPGRITLYKGQRVLKRSVPESEAISELVAIIRENGDWVEP